MKQTNKTAALLFTFVYAAVVLFSGCSSTGIQRSERATTTMKTVDNDIKLVSVQLDITGASLDELTKPGQSDVKKAFNLFKDNVSKIDKMERDFASHADEMKSRGKDYFAEWQKEGNNYKNLEIQKLSEARRIKLEEIYSQIAQHSIGVKNAFKDYISDVKEIQMYLSNDLTSKGIEVISPITQKVISDGEKLKTAIKSIQPSIERARTAMEQGGIE